MPKMTLPFGQIPPGVFDAAFQRPKSQATGLPMGVEQMAKAPAAAHLRGTGLPAGVESQAKQALSLDNGPQQPTMVNGAMQFQAPAKPAAGPDPTIMNQALAQQPAAAKAPPDVLSFLPKADAPFNPLGGMDPRPLSERGGPMNYSQRGVGTTNPNSFAVGSGRKSVGQRALERAARRGDSRAAAELARFAFGDASREDQQAHDLWKDTQATTRDEQGYQRTRADHAADTAENRSYQDQRDAKNHQQGLDVLQFHEDARNKRDAEERANNKGFSLQPLDPNDPSKGNAIMRGDGTLFNLLPGQKPEAPPPVLDFLRLPGTADAVPMYGDKPLPGAGIYTEQPGWSVKGLDQFMPKPKAQAPPTEILSFLPDGTLEGRTVRGPMGSMPTQPVKPSGDKSPSKPSGFAGRFSK